MYLSVTPRILAAALTERAGLSLEVDDATDDFVSAVADAYGQAVRQPDGLWVLARHGDEDLPESVAFLALTVLAAYEMRGDEEATANAYYLRLASLLGCGVVGGHPEGFDPLDFDDLWDELAAWADAALGRVLALPGPTAGPRTHIALPLTHVPLRRVDIEKLPEFFNWGGFEPEGSAGTADLAEPLSRWAATRNRLSRSGAAALADERRAAVVAQVAQELDAWDGSSTDAVGRRAASVQLLLDFVRRQPVLSFLPRRPPAFPAVFEAGDRYFESGEDGWYDPARVHANDGRDLEHGFSWACSTDGANYTLYRPASTAIALRPTGDYTGFVSQRGLARGIPCAVLCLETLETAAIEYLSDVSGVRCPPLVHPAVPSGWRLFPRVLAIRDVGNPPAGLDVVGLDPDVEILLSGGLRLGRRAAWLLGAPPRIAVAGLEPGQQPTVDGHPVTHGPDGLLDSDELLGAPGTHLIQVGGVRRRLEIVDPDVAWGSELIPETLAGALPVALPSGSWTLIGPEPGQVESFASASRAGAIARTKFVPEWAISIGPHGRTKVVALTRDPIRPRPYRAARPPRIGSRVQSWVSAVYDASVRRPRLGSFADVGDGVDLAGAWREYSHAARALKRQWRRRGT